MADAAIKKDKKETKKDKKEGKKEGKKEEKKEETSTSHHHGFHSHSEAEPSTKATT